MEMEIDILMDRPYHEKEHYVVPGGYSMDFGGRIFDFDFADSYGTADKTNPCIIHFECRENLEDDFPEMKKLDNINVFRKLNCIFEVYVHTGEYCDTEINVEKILSITLIDKNGNRFPIPDKYIEEYNKKMQQEKKTEQSAKNEAER